jgi:hypothetical protein
MLEQSDFLLKFLGVFSESVLLANILTVTAPPLKVIEVVAVRVQHDLCRVVEVNTCDLI